MDVTTYVVLSVCIVTIIVLAVWIYKILHPRVQVTKDDRMAQSIQLVGQIREVIVGQILNNHPKLFSAIAKQKTILNDQQRDAIAIFLSPNMFKELMLNYAEYSHEHLNTVYTTLRDLQMPIGFLGNLPIYISELMKESPVFVVGSISWEL